MGHAAAELQRSLGTDMRIFRKDVRHAVIFIAFDDTGNEKKQAPEKNIDPVCLLYTSRCV